MNLAHLFLLIFTVSGGLVIIRLLLPGFKKWCNFLRDMCHSHQYYRISEYNEGFQENQLYRKVSIYIQSLASSQDSDFADLFSGQKPYEIVLRFDRNVTVQDSFLGANISWKNEDAVNGSRSRRSFVLKIRKKDKCRVIGSYLQHIHTVSKQIEQNKKEIRLFLNVDAEVDNVRWASIPLTHPSTIDTIAMDSDLKNKIKSDLETFTKSERYYSKIGRIWKRSYLFYGPAGTGKSSFAVAAAKFLKYDIYNLDLLRISNDSDLKAILLQTTRRSVILIEDLDRYILRKGNTNITLSAILNFMDGMFTREEQLIIFTMNSKDRIDQIFLRPGRLDVHVFFPLCNFSSFKLLANSHLGLQDHKLFYQVEEILRRRGPSLSPAEISEILTANRRSPTRALKSVINALHFVGGRELENIERLSESNHLANSQRNRRMT